MSPGLSFFLLLRSVFLCTGFSGSMWWLLKVPGTYLPYCWLPESPGEKTGAFSPKSARSFILIGSSACS